MITRLYATTATGRTVALDPPREEERAALCLAVAEAIRENPEQWDQESWAWRTDCGTTYCGAGWAVQLSDRVEIAWHDANGGPDGHEEWSCTLTDPQYAQGRIHIQQAAAHLTEAPDLLFSVELGHMLTADEYAELWQILATPPGPGAVRDILRGLDWPEGGVFQ